MNISIDKIIKFSIKLKVLYVEDNSEARVSTLGFLHNIFNDITLAVNGKDGLDKFLDNNFDLLITDINMPKMNGIEMITKVREQNKDIPILILSAYNESGYFIETIKQGVEGYLLKPVSVKQFLEVIHKTVEKIYLRQEIMEYQNNLESKVKAQNKELYNQLHFDTLTLLPNRNSLLETIEKTGAYEIMLIDINTFSIINDIYGTEIGDKILVSISKLFVCICEPRYHVFKLSGDQFAFLNIDKKSSVFKQEVVKDILDNIENTTIYTDDSEDKSIAITITVTASIASNYPSTELLKNAELALHYAKNKRQYLIYYSDDLNITNHYKKELDAVQMVKRALNENRVVPFFQEIVKGEEEKTYECLVRIIDNDKVISPFYFLDAIKKTKYYSELTQVMIEKSFEYFRNTDTNFTINLSFEDISNKHTVHFIEKKLQETGISNQLILEIVESESIDNFDVVKKFIFKMQNLGVRIAIDDFGSGYSNFIHILELNPDCIKIDGSLVKNICEDEKSFIIVKAITNFAKELNIKVIAEFIHNEAVYEKIKTLNINGFQGYFFSEALRNPK